MIKVKHSLVGSCILLVALAACSTKQNDLRISELESQLNQTEQDRSALEGQIAALKQQEPEVQYVNAEAPLLPAEAKTGECYARVFVPPAYESYTEQMLKSEASERVEIIPARYEWDEEQVLIQEESERIEVVPATYKTVTERVMVKAESERLEDVPAVYETVTEKIMIKPAHTTWKKGRGPIEKINEATGEIMCLVEVPAEYRTVTKRVLKTPASTLAVKIPAEYETVAKMVVDQPATTRVVKIPAKYEAVKVRKLGEPARENRIAIPAEYQTVSKTKQTSVGHMEWRPILCETNVTPDIVARIQRALITKGYNPGQVDNVLGPDTMSAVTDFQRAKGLPSGQLTIETLKSLGVSLSS